VRDRSEGTGCVPWIVGGVLTVALCGGGYAIYREATDENVYCTDASNVVVDNRYCDSNYHGGGVYYVHTTPNTYHAGSVIPGGSSQRALSTDAVGRGSIGAGKTGPIGKAGGFGGSAHSSGGS
jgi:hypothetical protein